MGRCHASLHNARRTNVADTSSPDSYCCQKPVHRSRHREAVLHPSVLLDHAVRRGVQRRFPVVLRACRAHRTSVAPASTGSCVPASPGVSSATRGRDASAMEQPDDVSGFIHTANSGVDAMETLGPAFNFERLRCTHHGEGLVNRNVSRWMAVGHGVLILRVMRDDTPQRPCAFIAP